MKEELKALAKELGVCEIVEFVGRKTPEEVRDLYALSDSVVIPSLWESGPLTAFEAWAMELPLVITKVGMFANEADDSTYAKLVDAGDSKALAEAMEELLTDAKKRGDMITAGNEAVQKHTWAAMADIANDLYIEASRMEPVKRLAGLWVTARSGPCGSGIRIIQSAKIAGNPDALWSVREAHR